MKENIKPMSHLCCTKRKVHLFTLEMMKRQQLEAGGYTRVKQCEYFYSHMVLTRLQCEWVQYYNYNHKQRHKRVIKQSQTVRIAHKRGSINLHKHSYTVQISIKQSFLWGQWICRNKIIHKILHDCKCAG